MLLYGAPQLLALHQPNDSGVLLLTIYVDDSMSVVCLKLHALLRMILPHPLLHLAV